MIIFPTGLVITDTEHKSLLYMVADPEEWLKDAVQTKAKARQAALIVAWQPKLFADPDVTELPANDHDLCHMIMERSDYQSRKQQEETLGLAGEINAFTPVTPSRTLRNMGQTELVTSGAYNKARFNAQPRNGQTVTLFLGGLDILDDDCHCIESSVVDLEDWILGALLGQINRGKLEMIKTWHPIILDDPDVSTTPATQEGLINMIVARDDYKAMHR